MISHTVEYALRAVVYLAAQKNSLTTTQQIAENTRVPGAYLSKVMQSLSRAQLVHSQRGLGGGFSLARPPEQITILEVVRAVETIKRIRECPLGSTTHGMRLCPLHKRLDDALAMIEKAFQGTTLADLLAECTTSKPLCPFPNKPYQVSKDRLAEDKVKS